MSLNRRNSQLKNKKAKPSTYKKFFGRHEHRVIAEKVLGRPLKKGEIVHHKDGDKHNNSSENLEVMTQSEHIKMHKKELVSARWSRPRKIHCPGGHEYSLENTKFNKLGSPMCRICCRAATQAWKKKNAKRLSAKSS